MSFLKKYKPPICPRCFLSLITSLSFLVLVTSCTLTDERDVCCEGVTLLYRYVRTTFDEYRIFIKSERHFLFDGEGRFLREVYGSKRNPQRLIIRGLSSGNYTVVTVANATEGYTQLSPLQIGVSKLSDFKLSLGKQEADGVFAQAEELFWNSRTFHVERGKSSFHICDMANLHCHLFLKISWEDLPPKGSSLYQIELSHLAPGYTLSVDDRYSLAVAGVFPKTEGHESTQAFVWHEFPHFTSPDDAVVRVEETLQGQELYPELISFRYRDDAIPTLQIRHEGIPLFNKPIVLGPIFLDWGWMPNKSHEQIYRLDLYIKKDGNVVIKPWFSGSVEDWQDGGTFG